MRTNTQQPSASIKIGRISKEVEKAFSLTLACDVSIFLEENDMNELASAKPNRYLEVIHEMTEIIKKPDLVYFDRNAFQFIYFRFYASHKGFHPMGIRVGLQNHPNVWTMLHMGWYRNEDCKNLAKNGSFKRIRKERASRKA